MYKPYKIRLVYGIAIPTYTHKKPGMVYQPIPYFVSVAPRTSSPRCSAPRWPSSDPWPYLDSWDLGPGWTPDVCINGSFMGQGRKKSTLYICIYIYILGLDEIGLSSSRELGVPWGWVLTHVLPKCKLDVCTAPRKDVLGVRLVFDSYLMWLALAPLSLIRS